MGEVFLARDLKLGREVAVKFLRESLTSDPALGKRFATEAEIAASINHPNIVTVHEVGEFDGRPYFVMEYIAGKTLQEVAEDQPVPLEQLEFILREITTGLAEVHRKGLTHRDLKSSNIVLTSTGRVKILDFGLARSHEVARISEAGTLSGSMAYMSPEQITGGEIGPASDLFSLGVICYELLTGKLPFEGEYEAAITYAVVNVDPPVPEQVRKDTPPELSGIVMRLLQKDAARRFESADSLLQELESAFGRRDGKPRRGEKGYSAIYKAAGMVVIALIVVFTWWSGTERPSEKSEPVASIAVLPFENLGDKEDQYFADGMTAEIITNLSRIERLRVISRSSSMLYRDSELRAPEIGSDLDVAYLIQGTVFWDKSVEPNRLKVNVNLIRAAEDISIWGESYERTRDKVFLIQSDIARDVAGTLKLFVTATTPQDSFAAPTGNLTAYDFYLRGNEYFNRSWDVGDIRNAISMYGRAIGLDSGFAAAYAMLSRGNSSMYWEYFDRDPRRCLKAESAARHALELRSDLVEGRLALGYYHYHCNLDYAAALAQFDSALQVDPNNADGYNAIAAVQRRLGNFAEAARNFRHALRLDPRSHLKAFDVGLTLGMMREYAQSEQFMDRTITLAPDWALPYVYKAWLPILAEGDTARSRMLISAAPPQAQLSQSKYCWWLHRVIEADLRRLQSCIELGPDTIAYYLQRAQFHRLLGEEKQERAYADTALRLILPEISGRPEDARLHSYLGLAYAGLRQPDSALAHGIRAMELIPTATDAFDAPFWIVNLAESMVIFGMHNEAINQLETLLQIPGFVSVPYLKLDPLWKPLHNEPRFQKLVAQTSEKS